MTINKKAYITHFDCVCCAGLDSVELFDSICKKKDTLTINNTYVEGKTLCIGEIKSELLFYEHIFNTCNNILQNSNLVDFSDTLLLIGSSVGGMKSTEEIYFGEKNYKNIFYKEHAIDAIAYTLKKKYSFYDDISFSTACTSSANALAYAKEVISKNIYKNVLVIGVDSLSHTTVCGFSSLGVLSSSACSPFDKNRDGMNVSEAIATILVQDKMEKDSIEICGVGYSSDAYHMTRPHPEGEGAITAMSSAISNAGINISDISYINAHGTGTKANDLSEAKAIDSLFNKYKPNVCSTKSITGHTLGAAGALEAIISCMVLQNQIITPTKNLIEPEIETLNFPLFSKKEKISYALSNSFAFGGNNTTLVFGIIK